MKKLISIITINYNGLNLTRVLLGTLPLSEPLLEVVVVDNGSTADEATEIERRYPQVLVVRSTENLGFAGGNNLGVRVASGEYLFFLNNDTELPADCWQQMLQLVGRLQRSEAASSPIGVVCPKIRFAWENHHIQFAGYTPLSHITMRNRAIGFGEEDKGQFDTPCVSPYAHGAAMLISREAIERVGEMPECYFLYYEELDWSLMFRRAGYEIWYDPVLTVYHKESATTGQGSPGRAYYITRNRLLFASRNIDSPRRYLTYAYLMLLVAPRDIFKHLIARRFAHVRAVIRGLTHFIRGREGKYDQ